MERLDRLGVLAVVGFAVLVAVGVVTGDRSTDDPPAPDPVDALVDAYQRSRTATYRAAGTFERVGDDGARLEVPVELVQRRPDRLRRQFGEVSGHRGDRALLCPPASVGRVSECSLGPPIQTFDELVVAEVAEFRSLVTGSDPLYEVRRPVGLDRRGTCWVLTRTRNDPRGGYGESAELCFDLASGALADTRIDHGTVDEHTSLTDITTEVTDAMLEP